jgi:hypothetical protein
LVEEKFVVNGGKVDEMLGEDREIKHKHWRLEIKMVLGNGSFEN